MGKQNKAPATHRRPWRLLRLALLLARKGGAFKQRLFLDLRLLPSYLKNLRRADAADRLRYREREFSFEDTPTFHFKIHRPALLRLPGIPCITPSVSFDDDEEIFIERCKAMKLLEAGVGKVDEHDDELCSDTSSFMSDLEEEVEEQEIDSRAENFIMEFYEQIKLQRQISYLEYNEMLHRGMSS